MKRTMEDEIKEYWPARHAIAYWEQYIRNCEAKIERAKQRIEEAKQRCVDGKWVG